MTAIETRTTTRLVASRRAFVGAVPLEVQPEVDVTLLTSADPGSCGLIPVMPTEEEQAANPRLQGWTCP